MSTPPLGWFSASRTRNFLLDDPILDWLQMHGASKGYVPDTGPGVAEPTDFSAFIMAKGQAFEAAVLTCLRNRVANVEVITTSRQEVGSTEGVDRTVAAMKRGVPIIAQGTIRDDRTRSYGAPDLLIRSDVLLQLVPSAFEPEVAWLKRQDILVNAAGIASTRAPVCEGAFHYRVVDIKFTGLHLDRHWHAGNSGSMPAYKGQVWLYNQMLEQAQGYLPPSAFLLGRSFEKGTTENTRVEGRGCLDRIAPVFLDAECGAGRRVSVATLDALNWLRRCSTEGATWSAEPKPSVNELRPNMKQRLDQPWHRAKRQIAMAQQELTLLWQIGVDLRNRAVAGQVPKSDGGFHPPIERADDPGLCAATIGLTKPAYAPMLDALLRVQRSDAPTHPEVVTADAQEWRPRKKLELFVDFETVSDLNDDFAAIPERGGQALIFMGGVGMFADDGQWVFECFIADALTVAAEGAMLSRFFDHVTSLCERAGTSLDEARVFHWSPAEESSLDTALRSARSRHPQASWPVVPWYDFLRRVVKAQPFVVRGATGFGLKAIGKALHSHGLISTSWTDGPTDGLGAMVAAWRADEEARSSGGAFVDTALIKEIRQYNEVDCKVMAEVIGYLRRAAPAPAIAEQV